MFSISILKIVYISNGKVPYSKGTIKSLFEAPIYLISMSILKKFTLKLKKNLDWEKGAP